MAERKINRRQFMQTSGAGILALGALGLSRSAALAAPPSLTPEIAVVSGSPAKATRAAVEALGGMKAFVKPGQKVIIKPNMSFIQPPEAAANTHPEVVRELVIMCKEAQAGRVLIMDHCINTPASCLERSGIADIIEPIESGIVLGLQDSRFFRDVDLPQAAAMKKTQVFTAFLESDVLIAAPVAKSHSGAGVSLSLKGMMGMVYDRRSMHSGHDLAEAIVDICTYIKPQLVVVDASRVLTSNGPGGPGKVANLNTIVATRDMVAADAQTVLLSQWYERSFQPSQVKHIRLAHERGLGRMDVENLRVNHLSA